MPLSPGSRLGPYDVTGALGEGGMGQVYRATDTKLKRQVAIKILAPAFASDTDRIARLQREAEVLAALNHPHIAAIYGLEESDGVKALIMEFVSGDDLSRRLSRGALTLDEALPIARQIADALEAAHDQGIVHRDLKPANIKVRDDGTVKVLDFGLAKMLEPSALASGGSLPATITSPVNTHLGSILGTAAYMSPEQARGKPADKRSDVWAFGCVFYEMLTGRRAFEGDEITDVLAAVVRDEPDWTRLPAATPAPIRRVLRRALTKDRRHRLADMADVRLELEEMADAPAAAHTVAVPAAPRSRPIVPWVVAAAAVVAAIAAFAARPSPAAAPDVNVVRFDVPPPVGNLEWGQPLSPDGRTLAFITRVDGKSQIWVRPLDSAAARMLPGTEGATRSFWSPDSQHVAYLADGNLMEVAITGSTPRLITRGPFRDGAWSASGVMLVGGQRGRPLMRVPERGGEAVAETTLDPASEISHDYPEFLPDGRHYIFMSRGGTRAEDFTTYLATLGSTERRVLAGIRSAVKYSSSGHLLFIRGATLMAQAFDLGRLDLSGDAFPIAEEAAGNRVGTFSVSQDGSLAFFGGMLAESNLEWFERNGRPSGRVGPKTSYRSFALSPNGRAVAFERGSPPNLWLLDLDRGAITRITSNPFSDSLPVWSPDGRTLAFASNRGGRFGLYQRATGGGEDHLVLQTDAPIEPSDWSRDGRYVAYATGGDVWAIPLAGDRTPIAVTASPRFQEFAATFSPDGQWIAYQSDEASSVTRSGEGDVFVQSFPQRGQTQQVSTGGGFAPRWSADGKELFYVAPDGVLRTVSIAPSSTGVEIGATRPLFAPGLDSVSIARPRFALAPDGRFLARTAASELSITVIVNWFEQLKRAGATR